jgi:hypothetical protein
MNLKTILALILLGVIVAGFVFLQLRKRRK